MANEFDDKCDFISEAVAYLYGEMPVAERNAFENHLANCEACTDEFAAVSYSRLSVLEWQRGEFAELRTPEIVIPYGEVAASNGWMDGIRGLFAAPAFAMAALLLVVGLAFVGYYVNSGKETPTTVAEGPRVETTAPSVTSSEVQPAAVSVPPVNSTRPAPVSGTERVRAAATQRAAKVVRPLTADLDTKIKPAAPAAKRPALLTVEEDEDNSLRLADLLDEGGV